MKTNELMLQTILDQKEDLMELEVEVKEIAKHRDEMARELNKLREAYRVQIRDHQDTVEDWFVKVRALERRIADMAPQKQFRVFGYRDSISLGDRIQYALPIESVSSLNGVTTIDVKLDA